MVVRTSLFVDVPIARGLTCHRPRLTTITFKTAAAGTITDVIRYTYDALGRRIQKKVDVGNDSLFELDERYAYNGDRLSLVFDAAGSLTNRYLYAGAIDAALAEETHSGSSLTGVEWLLGDHQGSIRDVLDDAGDEVAHFAYDAFGNLVDHTPNEDLRRFAYTGQAYDAETGYYYMAARYYDPTIGRFLSEDPLGFDAGDVNLYRYVNNSPILYVDPTGLRISSPLQMLGNFFAPTVTSLANLYQSASNLASTASKWASTTWSTVTSNAQTSYNNFGTLNPGRHTSVNADPIQWMMDSTPRMDVNLPSVNVSGISPNAIAATIAKENSATSAPQAVSAPSSKWSTMDYIDMVWDAVGTAEPTGLADTTHALSYLLRGEFANAGMTIAGVIPWFGDTVKGGKYLKYADEAIEVSARYSSEMVKSVDAVAPALIKPLTQNQKSAVSKIENILNKNFKQGRKGDISGAIHDMVGNPIPNPLRGGTYDHVQDLDNMLRGLRKGAESLKTATDPSAVTARERALQTIQQIEEAIKGAGL